MVGELVKQLSPTDIVNNGENSQNNKRKRNSNSNKDVNAKYFKSLIQERIKNYIMVNNEDDDDNNSEVEDSDNEDVDDDVKTVPIKY